MESDDTMDALKERICQKEGIPLDEKITLLLEGNQMEDGKILVEYNI